MTKPFSFLQDQPLFRQQAMQSVFDGLELCEGSLIVDRDARVVWINDRYAARLGLDPAKVIGSEIETCIPNSLMRQIVVTGKPIPLDVFQASGHTFVVIRLPVRDEQGEVVGAVAFALFSDIEAMRPIIERFSQLQAELAHTQKKLDEARRTKFTFSSFLGNSPAIMEVKRLGRRAALLNAPVLLQGETGTGKELLAHAIHAGGPRANHPFVTVNVAAIPETLLEAEFFGVAPGAYTGADRKRRRGKFEIANGGTLFLDEIGEMSLALQSKLLRVLQDNEFEPLGSNQVIAVDVRILAATSRDLKAMVADGRFRKDLFYRLDVLSIQLPPLRGRTGDLELLCEHLLEKIGIQTGHRGCELNPEAMGLLLRHSWPGNVRELQNVLERAMMKTDRKRLEAPDFKELVPEVGDQGEGRLVLPPGSTLSEALAEAGRQILESALKSCNGNVPEAARKLGIGRATFYRRMSAFQSESHKREDSQI
jgi:transcriptional regulator with PAS, ATPase and Fis domain